MLYNSTVKQDLLISVMIPVYNRAYLLKDSLQSVMNQHLGIDLMEVWVVDDCSTKDDPLEVVNSYREGIVKFYKQPINVGQINNLNKCIELANGKLIHILHCDDKTLPGFYDRIIRAYTLNPNAGAYFSRNNYINHDGSIDSFSEIIQEKSGIIDNFFEKISTRQLIQTPAVVVKKDVYYSVGMFKQKLTWSEDWEMWVRISQKYPVYYINEILVEYRFAIDYNSADSYKTGRFIVELKKTIDEIYLHHKSKKIKKNSISFFAEFIFKKIVNFNEHNELKKKNIFDLILKFYKYRFFCSKPYFYSKYFTKLIIKWYR